MIIRVIIGLVQIPNDVTTKCKSFDILAFRLTQAEVVTCVWVAVETGGMSSASYRKLIGRAWKRSAFDYLIEKMTS